MYEHNAFGYWWGLALCLLTKVSSSRARCPATALIIVANKHATTLSSEAVDRTMVRTEQYT